MLNAMKYLRAIQMLICDGVCHKPSSMMHAIYRVLAGCCVLWISACHTTTMSPTKPYFAPNTSTSARIAYIATQEHQVWRMPFIDGHGRLRRYSATEAQHQRLADGMFAWQKVMSYWQTSQAIKTLARHEQITCRAFTSKHNPCRYFVSDVPWSAAFVSYVMTQAQVEGFVPSARHFDYIYQAWQNQGVYRLSDPSQTPLMIGDMLCYLRGQSQVVGYVGLTNYLANHSGDDWLPAHCDIVVKVLDKEVWLIGGNIADTVLLRKLPLDDKKIAILPAPLLPQQSCSVFDETACNLNRQNWAAVLKLTDDK